MECTKFGLCLTKLGTQIEKKYLNLGSRDLCFLVNYSEEVSQILLTSHTPVRPVSSPLILSRFTLYPSWV